MLLPAGVSGGYVAMVPVMVIAEIGITLLGQSIKDATTEIWRLLNLRIG